MITPHPSELDDALLPLEERLARRLEHLRATRERLIADAQRQLAALDGAIAELAALLEPATQNESEADAKDA